MYEGRRGVEKRSRGRDWRKRGSWTVVVRAVLLLSLFFDVAGDPRGRGLTGGRDETGMTPTLHRLVTPYPVSFPSTPSSFEGGRDY